MRLNKKKISIASVVGLSVAIIATWLFWGNSALITNELTIPSERVPENFVGYRIVQISDFHNVEMGKDNEKLIAKMKEANPDMIVMTGDLVDSYHPNIEVSIAFAAKAVQIAPCYYVTGNHEARIAEYPELIEGLKKVGVTVMQDEALILEKENERITLLGLSDPSFSTDYLFGDDTSIINARLNELKSEPSSYTILLSHRPELFDTYVLHDVDLVFSGHAHGGQFRLPFVGGLIAPNQGLFPKYDSGIYTKHNTSMVVSRGIGNSIIPFRIHNRPEIIVVELSN
ncbi:MAG: metallophosphoesterase [Erysipelotrichaceae bacterium]